LISGKGGKVSFSEDVDKKLEKAAAELLENKGSTLVVAGSNDKAVQTVVNAINDLLGNYGTTINLALPVNFRKGNDEKMATFISEAKNGKVAGVIFYNCNPAAIGSSFKTDCDPSNFSDRSVDKSTLL